MTYLKPHLSISHLLKGISWGDAMMTSHLQVRKWGQRYLGWINWVSGEVILHIYWSDEQIISIVSWEYGGTEVFLMGSFNQWERQLKLSEKQDGEFEIDIVSFLFQQLYSLNPRIYFISTGTQPWNLLLLLHCGWQTEILSRLTQINSKQ